MSLPTDTDEEKKMLEYLKDKGITTLEQLKVIFKDSQEETMEEEVVFVKQVAGPSISEEKMNQLIEASARNKEKLLDVLSKTTNAAENSKSPSQPQPVNPKKIVAQSNSMAELGNCVVHSIKAVDVASLMNDEKHDSSITLRYRQKNGYQTSPQPTNPPKQTRTNRKQQQRERNRQAAKQNELQRMTLGINMQHSEFNQYPQCINQPQHQSTQTQCTQYNENGHHNQQPICNTNTLNNHTLPGIGQNIPTIYNSTPSFNNANAFTNLTRFNNHAGFNHTASNNTTNYNNPIGFNHATDFNNATRFNRAPGFNNGTGYNNAKNFKTSARFDNSIGQTTQVAPPMVSANVYNGPRHQTWPAATPLPIGQSYNDNFMRYELATQAQSQPTSAPYMLGNRPIFDPI